MSRDFRTSVYLPQDLLWLARYKFGDDFNLSDFTRKALMALVTDGERVETPLSQMVKTAVAQVRKDLEAQQRITQDAEQHQKAAQDYLETRKKAIHEATVSVLLKVRNFERLLPENDHHGDLATELDRVIDRVSKESGYDVDLTDVMDAYRGMRAGVMP